MQGVRCKGREVRIQESEFRSEKTEGYERKATARMLVAIDDFNESRGAG